MGLKENIKGWKTDILGVGLISLSVYLFFDHPEHWSEMGWDDLSIVVGLAVLGATAFLIPDTFVNALEGWVGKIFKRKQ